MSSFHFPSEHHVHAWGSGGSSRGVSKESADSALKLLSHHNLSHPRKADQIQPGIYLGDLSDALDHVAMTEKKITHVLSVIDNCPDLALPDFVQHKIIAASDDPGDALLEHFKEGWRFISNAITDALASTVPKDYNHGKILVHCEQGISRSATVLAAFLMKEERLHSLEALAYIRKFRPIVDPNEGFREQLHVWGQCRGEIQDKLEYNEWKRKRRAASARK